MPSVALSDRLYLQIERAAKSNGVSVEEFVADTLEAEIEHEPLVLTPEEEASVRQSQEDIRAGRFSTVDEAFARLDARKAAYLAENPR